MNDAAHYEADITMTPTELLDKAATEIERLTEANRRALAIADERGKENDRMRQLLRDARDHVPWDVLKRIDAVLGNHQ